MKLWFTRTHQNPQTLHLPLQTFHSFPNMLNFLYFLSQRSGSFLITMSLYRLHPELSCTTHHLKGTADSSSQTRTTVALLKPEPELSASYTLLHNSKVSFKHTYF